MLSVVALAPDSAIARVGSAPFIGRLLNVIAAGVTMRPFRRLALASDKPIKLIDEVTIIALSVVLVVAGENAHLIA